MPMVEADLAAVLEIERLASPSPWTQGIFLHELQLAFSRIVLARSGAAQSVLGFACWWEVASEIHILNVAVHPSQQRRGIGKALVRLILDDGMAAGATVAGLEVRAENRAGLALYERCGFARVGQRQDYYGSGQHAILMDCRLPQRADDDRRTGPA